MEDAKKGTVTSLASIFPAEEAQKAAKRVEDTIAEKEKELDRLRGFIADNNNLINLVQKLPEELHHDIMVPFGKAAFFPGRLIHTNEFLVLLGEGYYAERTSKQTTEILKRRGKSLDSQINSLEAIIEDHKAEASFFSATASEAAEGLVEIREDYEEENSGKGEFKSGILTDADKVKATADDEEFARMMSRLDELEKEELAAESGNHSDENEETTSDFDEISYQKPIDINLQNSEDTQQRITLEQINDKSIATEFPGECSYQEDISDQLNFASLALQSQTREGKSLAKNLKNLDATSEKSTTHLEEKMVQPTTASKSVVIQHQPSQPLFDRQKASTSSIVEHAGYAQRNSKEKNSTSSQVGCRTSEPSFDSSKAFTGSILEHAGNLQTREKNSTSSQVTGSQPSKPVSRFRMQRR
ncbi:RNA polymerase II subunit 5-mediating protein-like protein [Senna tora]|uniref:RNA polymerase II subunit 5-mediating protein-like protein n=1 Tax=Senna tora TaxID=362788 RepID=A0A834TLB8_9FABA|nr:RNA polymerase II subunit 5-mediating protein-like protein [Senna tora]